MAVRIFNTLIGKLEIKKCQNCLSREGDYCLAEHKGIDQGNLDFPVWCPLPEDVEFIPTSQVGDPESFDLSSGTFVIDNSLSDT